MMINTLEEFIDLYDEKHRLAFRYLPSSRRGCDILLEFISKKSLGYETEVYEYLLLRYDRFLTLNDLKIIESKVEFGFGEEQIKMITSRIRKELIEDIAFVE